MIDCLRLVDTKLDPLRIFATWAGVPLLDLSIRLVMASIFFNSGWSKLQNALNGDWASTVYLFSDVHPLPGIPPEIAAILGTGGELSLSVLLAFGLFTRFAAAGLIVMTMVIQFLIPAEYGLMNQMHYLWMLLLAVPLFYGAGKLSMDFWLTRWLRGA